MDLGKCFPKVFSVQIKKNCEVKWTKLYLKRIHKNFSFEWMFWREFFNLKLKAPKCIKFIWIIVINFCSYKKYLDESVAAINIWYNKYDEFIIEYFRIDLKFLRVLRPLNSSKSTKNYDYIFEENSRIFEFWGNDPEKFFLTKLKTVKWN